MQWSIIHMVNNFIITTHLPSQVCNYSVKLCLPSGRRQLTWIISHYIFCKFNLIKFTQQRLLRQHVVSTNSIIITRQFNNLSTQIYNYSATLCLPSGRQQLAWITTHYTVCNFNWIKFTQRLLRQHVVSTNSIKITR